MKNFKSIVIVLVLITLVVGGFLFLRKNGQSLPVEIPTPNQQVVEKEKQIAPKQPDSLKVVSLEPGDVVTSPLTVKGQASGWYFEAVFPIRVTDENGRTLGSGQARSQGDWMTSDFVPFMGVITFDSTGVQKGFVVFEKDNPSGLPENALSYSIPVRFAGN